MGRGTAQEQAPWGQEGWGLSSKLLRNDMGRLEFSSHRVQPVQVAKHCVPAHGPPGRGYVSVPCSTAAHPPALWDPAGGWGQPHGHPRATGSERLDTAGESISPAHVAAAASPQVPSPWGSGKGLPHPWGALPGKPPPEQRHSGRQGNPAPALHLSADLRDLINQATCKKFLFLLSFK